MSKMKELSLKIDEICMVCQSEYPCHGCTIVIKDGDKDISIDGETRQINEDKNIIPKKA